MNTATKTRTTLSTKTPAQQRRDTKLAAIAAERLGLETLETRNSDGLDFSDQAVWSLKAALEAAYEAGAQAAIAATAGRR